MCICVSINLGRSAYRHISGDFFQQSLARRAGEPVYIIYMSNQYISLSLRAYIADMMMCK